MMSLSRVRLLATPWAAAHPAPPSMGFSRQEYWSGVPLSSPLLIPTSPHSFVFLHSLKMEEKLDREAIPLGGHPSLETNLAQIEVLGRLSSKMGEN